MEDCHKFEDSLGYRVRPCFKNKQETKWRNTEPKGQELWAWRRNPGQAVPSSLAFSAIKRLHLEICKDESPHVLIFFGLEKDSGDSDPPLWRTWRSRVKGHATPRWPGAQKLASCIQRTKTVEASRNTWCGSLCPQRRVWLWTLTRLVSHRRKLGLHPAMPNELTELAPGYQPTRKGCRSQMLLYDENNIYISVGLKLYWPDAVSFS